MDSPSKRQLYRQIEQEIAAVVEGLEDPIATMATCACLLFERLPWCSWAGFYRVIAPRLLRVGPYQGPLGCLDIPFDRGICGAAARERKTQMVADVHAFAGHIACDSTARSEIVVPVFDPAGELIAVLDLDSRAPAAFDEADREGLESIVERLRPAMQQGTGAPLHSHH
jgi:GAF domain-containing protein